MEGTLLNLSVSGCMEGTLLNLSVSGCCIETKAPFPDIENPYVEVILCVDWITLRIAGWCATCVRTIAWGLSLPM
jgi:hypothetical protein